MEHRHGKLVRTGAVLVVLFAALVGPNTRALASPATTPTLTAPIDGAVVGGLVPLGATSTAPAVQFTVDGVALGAPVEVDAGSASTTWASFGLPNDTAHLVAAADCDDDGCAASSSSASVTVHNAAPVLTDPTAGEQVGASTTFAATATGGGVAFLLDGAAIAFDGSAPYRATVSGLAAGGHKVAVRACNAAGTMCAGPTSRNAAFTVRVLLPSIVSVSPSPFSPNGDGRRDAATVTYTLPDAESVAYSIVLTNTGATVRSGTIGNRAAGRYSFVWAGTNNAGARVADGTYTVRLSTHVHLSASEVARGTSARDVRVDDTRPSLTGVTGNGKTFYPYPDKYVDTWTPTVQVSERARVYLDITTTAGALVRRLTASTSAAATVSIAWDGKASTGARVAAGTYQFRFWAQDTAGNRQFGTTYHLHVSAKRLVDRTATTTRAGNTASVVTTGGSGGPLCFETSTANSRFANGLWMQTVCSDASLGAAFSVTVPAAYSYTSVAISSYGATRTYSDRIWGAWWDSSHNVWQTGSLIAPPPGPSTTSQLGTRPAAGLISDGHVLVQVAIGYGYPNVDFYDLGTVTVTIAYRVLE